MITPLKAFDSDEAVVGLMAREILAGESWPVFYAGQSYLGALEPWSVAASFALLGESASSLRLVPLLYTLLLLVALFFLFRRFFSFSVSALILLWTALGTPSLNLLTVRAVGGHVESLLCGTLFLLAFERTWCFGKPRPLRLAALGTVAGFALFVSPLSGALMLVPLLMLMYRTAVECRPVLAADGWTVTGLARFAPVRARARRVFRAMAGIGLLALLPIAPIFVIGDAVVEEWLGISIAAGSALVTYVVIYFCLLYLAELTALSRTRPGGFTGLVRRLLAGSAGMQMILAIVAGDLFFVVASELAVAVLGGGGFVHPLRLAPVVDWPARAVALFGEIVPIGAWPPAGLAGPLAAGTCIVLAALLFRRRGDLCLEARGAPPPVPALLLFGGTTLVTPLAIVVTAYTLDASSVRYLAPLLVSAPATAYLLLEEGLPAIGAGRFVRISVLALATLGIVAGAAWGPASALAPRTASSPFPELLREIESRGGERFIADFWTAYPLAFLAHGTITVVPADGVDRFPPVTAAVKAVGPDAFVFLAGTEPLRNFRASPDAVGFGTEVTVRSKAAGLRYHLFYTRR